MWWWAYGERLTRVVTSIPATVLALAAGAVAVIGVVLPSRSVMAERLCGVLLAPLGAAAGRGRRGGAEDDDDG